jgi:hypothetical protein
VTIITIDRLTFLGDVSETSNLEVFLADSEYVKHRGFSKYPYRDYVTFIDGSILQLAETGAVRSGKVQGLRYEFNPNNTLFEPIHINVLKHFKYARVSRIDIAMDVFDVDMSSWHWLDKKSRKQNHWIDGLGKKETVYVGGKDSDLKLRIYNKALEQNDCEKTWWRVEVQLRGDVADSYRRLSLHGQVNINPFEDVTPVQNKDFGHLDIKDRAMIAYLLQHPDGFAELSKNTRSKYKKLMKEHVAVTDVDLKTLWNEKSSELGSELDSWYKLTDRFELTS